MGISLRTNRRHCPALAADVALERLKSLARHLILPVLMLGLVSSPSQAQHEFASSITPRGYDFPATRLDALEQNISKLTRMVSFNFNDEPLETALQQISARAELNLMYGSNTLARQQNVTMNRSEVTVLAALQELIRGRGLGIKISPSGYLVIVDQPADEGDLAISAALAHTVEGRVVGSDEGQPMPGVNVRIKNQLIGTTTDSNGFYVLEAPSATDTLVFSFVGFETQEIPIAGRSEILVTMEPDVIQGGEVVVIGYGEKSRALLTESIGTIQAEQIRQLPVASADAALQGRMSGVQVTSVDGTPGSPVAIRIRGVGTVGNTQPLFVVDGIPVGRGEDATTNPLSTINPADIESISVLKDASAAAAYGVRAANGVVLITTKRGELGKPTVSADAYYGVQRFPELWEMNTTAQYIELTQDAYDAYNAQRGLTEGDDAFLTLHPDLQAGSRYVGIDNAEDWIQHAANENAPIQNYNVSVSGATNQLNYFVSGGFFNQQAIINRWDLDRYTFRANSDYSITPRIRIGETFSVSYQTTEFGMNAGGDGFLLRNAATMPPFFEILDADNSVPDNRYGFEGNLDVAGLTVGNQNAINEIIDNNDRTTRLIGGLHGEIDLIGGLSFRTAASLDLLTTRNDSWNPGYRPEEAGLDRNTPRYGDGRGESYTQVFTNMLNYAATTGAHSVDVIAGMEYQKLRSTFLSGNAEQFLSTDPAFYRVIKNGTSSISLGGGAGESAFMGYISRVSYDYLNKYLVTATLRRDGSSRFSPEDGRRWGTFPSVSAAWRVSEEPFFDVPLISSMKLRGSWGRLGNDQTRAFPHLFRVSVTPDYGIGGESVQVPVPVNFVNKDVTWETVETVDFGVDFSLFNDRLDVLATYYNRNTKDFLIDIPIPLSSGFVNDGREATAPVNAGNVLNRGFELEVDYRTRVWDRIDLGIGANLTTVHNEITALTEGINEFLQAGSYRTAVGQPIGYLYGYKTDGIFQSQDEIDTYRQSVEEDKLSPDGPMPGDIRFLDVNGPAPEDAARGVQFSGEPDGIVSPEDRTYLGKTIPDAFYGINLDAGFKRWDVSLFFQGVTGVQLYNAFRQEAESLVGGGRNQLASTQERWDGAGTSDEMPRAVATDPNNNNRFSDRWVEDAGFFRLKNVQIGYTIPASLLRGTRSARVYVAMTNLFTITPYSGLDPEVMTYRSNGSQIGQDVSVGNPPSGGSGTDSGNIPQSRTFRVGFQMQF